MTAAKPNPHTEYTETNACDASNTAEWLLTLLPESEVQLAKILRAFIDRTDKKYKLHTICLDLG